MALVRAIHAASLRADEWPEVLEQLRRHLDARVVTLAHHQFSTGSDSIVIESPGSGDFARDMAVFCSRNPWFLSSDEYVPGRVMTGDELIRPGDLRRTDFYRGFLQPRGLLHLLCGVIDQRADGTHFLSVYRAENQAAFEARERVELEIVLEHVKLALENSWRWQEADDLSRAMSALSDSDANPVLLVTAGAEPVYRNPAADRLLERRSGLCLEGGCVVAASPADRRLLSETIGRIARFDPMSAGAAPSVLTLAGTLPTVAVVRPAGQIFTRLSGVRRGLAMIAVRGSYGEHDSAHCLFASKYTLTAAQAKVSALVYAGRSLPAISNVLNVSENTVRSHLKQIFQKTETHSQMELVHLHARFCTGLV